MIKDRAAVTMITSHALSFFFQHFRKVLSFSFCMPAKTLFAFSGFSLDCLLFLGKSFKFISGCTSCFLSDQFDSTIQFLILVFGSVDDRISIDPAAPCWK